MISAAMMKRLNKEEKQMKEKEKQVKKQQEQEIKDYYRSFYVKKY